MKRIIIMGALFLSALPSFGQNCIGGAVRTNDNYLYGRFETRMRSVGDTGVVSSFFLYNSDIGCNWPAENNEIDIEMLGNGQDLLFTTHYPGPWYYTDTYTPNFNPHAAMHDYAFEWEPGVVRWFVDGQLVNVQSQPFVTGLIHSMRIHMNLWVADLVSWVGPWDPSVMPVESEYEYVRYYEYTPGVGDTGTNNDYTFMWEDQFDSLDLNRWEVSEFGGFGGNLCSFESTSVEVDSGRLYLQLEPEQPNIQPVPLTVSVQVHPDSFVLSDQIWLAGSFNSWCVTCDPLNKDNDSVWSITKTLPPGKHEYIFVKNNWESTGKAPIGSTCDFQPCDQWNNYGVTIPHNSFPITMETVCWDSCFGCNVTVSDTTTDTTTPPPSLFFEPNDSPEPRVIGIYDVWGRPTQPNRSQMYIIRYDNGRVEKRYYIKPE